MSAFGFSEGADLCSERYKADQSIDREPCLHLKASAGIYENLKGEFPRFPIDVRIMVTMNRDLKRAITAGKFRQDIYYRLNVFPIQMPALRERNEDSQLPARHFVRKCGLKFGKKIDTIPETMMNTLNAYSWPGNIRELENIIERAVIISRHSRLQLNGFRDFSAPENSNTHTPQTLLEVERDYILRVLEDCSWIIEGRYGAAARLGLNPGTLRSHMKKLGIKRPQNSA